MKLRFLAIHPLIGTKHKPAIQHLMERSPYYWWWDYLRRNEDYLACCDAGGTGELAWLYEDFGDVRSDDFRSWWGGSLQRGAKLFAEKPVEVRLEQLDSKDEWDEDWPDDIEVIAVNMSIGRRKLQQYFANFLKREHKGKRGRVSLGQVKSTAKYPLYGNFSQHTLRVRLITYDAYIENKKLPKSEQVPLWKVGENLRLVPTAMPKPNDGKYETTDKHNVMTATVSRYVREAKAIIANTAKGQFPNSKKPSV
ncbi:hypothetical protein P9J64_13570 [Deltaproteobacteria bacterium IMCC39524]|nr:hypothetical protein [Deltaproteobacteria bacterium IMCC39524]